MMLAAVRVSKVCRRNSCSCRRRSADCECSCARTHTSQDISPRFARGLAARFGSSVAQGDFRKHTNQCMLLLQGIVRGDWYGAVLRVRAAVNECGFVLEEHPFSGIMMNFRIELLRERAADFNAVLEQQGIVLDATSLANWRSECGSPSRDPIDAMLVILFVDGDPDKTQIVPAVPG